ncbi:receptor-type tyrosine-protein phosphatase delta isoform X2 [Rhipicephalus sanguineus]|uniref:receptor-type tyrosine-protein phosphatase delta isoform X2 n=1 Tax=Rhipicephalus sanguineus TaxID=34632 RepID=UPI0020C36CFE|nr:receptor-type tyrosine-protein phosphatase delta isoform X2 [Rhipicephalus sanguineus]
MCVLLWMCVVIATSPVMKVSCQLSENEGPYRQRGYVDFLRHPPSIVVFPRDQTVVTGRVAVFVCTAVGNPRPQIEWRKNGKRVSTNRYTVTEMTGGSVLRIDPVRAGKDNATYECLAENGVGEPVRAQFTLTVLEENQIPPGFPHFKLLPNLQGVERNRSALLPCKAEGDPEPRLSWLRNDIPVDMSNPRYSLAAAGSLQIFDAQEEDQGNYECIAENSVGTAISPMATLFVRVRRVPPYFSIPPESTYEVSPGATLNLTCVAVGSPMPFVRWRKGHVDLTADSEVPVGRNVLVLENVRESANYTCVAGSTLGSIEHVSQVLVQALPRSPTNLAVSDVTATSVRLSWSYEGSGSDSIRYYVVQYKPRQANREYSETSGITMPYHHIRDLSPYTEYEFYVIAVNDLGRGSPSVPVTVTTGETADLAGGSKPGSAPRNLQARTLSSSTVVVQWDPPKEPNGQVMGYNVYYTTQPSIPTQSWSAQTVDNNQLTTISNLTPQTIYTIRVQAFTSRGPGPFSSPVQVKTQQGVPSQPRNLKAVAVSPTAIQLNWTRPLDPAETVVGYELYWNDTFTQQQEQRSLPDGQSFLLEGLYPDTVYYVWLAARSRTGEGAATPPLPVRTDQYVPGEPRTVKVTALNSTALAVSWKPPSNRDRNGLIRGYQIHVQEMNRHGDLINEPLRYDVADETAEEYNVTGLQPDTEYSVQVAAVTRKGDGSRSRPKMARTHGGVPTRPELTARIHTEDQPLRVELHWSRPNHTYGELLQYRLRYGRMDGGALEEREIEPMDQHITVDNLARGARYEFRLSGRNLLGWGQEAITFVSTPEGEPTSPPLNVTFRLQSPTTVVFTWEPPIPVHRNGHITHYSVQFRRRSSDFSADDRNTSHTRVVFSSLDEKTDYIMRVRACTAKGCGPWSENLTASTPGDIPSAPTNVQAVATSDQSVEVWWDEMPYFRDILGYQVLYAQTAVEDLDQWAVKKVPLTWSAELTSLESHTVYAIRVAAYTRESLGKLSDLVTVKVTPTDVPTQLRAYGVTTHGMILSWRPPTRLDYIKFNISYSAHKEFYDSRGSPQELPIPPQSVLLEIGTTNFTIENLIPFTSYKVNLTAVPRDGSYRPPAKIMVTTAMAAPKPMVKPDAIWHISNGDEITVMLPKASEEYGPIKQYYLVVVPSEFATKEPDDYKIEELMSTPLDEDGPYIAAAFVRQNMPERFVLGDMKVNGGFRNRKLQSYRRYRIFVRAVVDTLQKNLFTTSPFSDELSLEMLPQVRLPSADDVPNVSHIERARTDVGWIIGPVLLIVFMALFLTLFFILMKRRRQQAKAPAGETTMKLLMNSGDLASSHPGGVGGAGTDPVELRRLNYQTPAMVGHPPIPVSQLATHIETLKANDNLRFSQEYESIDPGQQFTWEHSNLESNKPKNRYANVVAYDHSRVVLQPIEGIPGSDYINANYCDGYRRRNAYIATQGPLPETCGDFWRMVWEQHSVTIVMMTKLEERTRVKCDQYWPSRGSESYGLMEVTLEDVQELATYCIRTFSLKRSGYLERREVRQFQFTAWPDHGVPDHPTPFLMFLRRVRAMNPPEAGPLIVHCSAGVGRTGCFVVIDSMLERMRHEGTVDIYGHVTCLRAQRNYMVQTEDQYLFIHDALLEAVLAGNTEVPARALAAHLQSLLQLVPGEACTGMEIEFKKLANMKTQANKFVSANLPVNKFKNRLMNILPYESTRVCLQPIRGVDGSDYINASFIDGYRYRNAYIATQGPMVETTEDFWRMVWEHNSNIIVMLTKLKEMGREKCHQYWPSEHSQRYLYYVVDPITEYNMPQYILREFKVTDAKDGQSRTIRQFHFTDWPEQGVPKTSEGYLEFLGQVHKTKEQFGQEGPITVHCSAGVGRTGVFITLSIVLERLQSEGVLDIFQTVRTLRTQRPGMVQSEDQYQFCYRAALEYMSSFDHYAN